MAEAKAIGLGTSTKKWSEVVASPEFQKLSTPDKEASRHQYFEQVIAPQLPKDQIADMRAQFDTDTKINGEKERLPTDQEALLAEAYKRGLLPPDMKGAYEEALKRGLIPMDDPWAVVSVTAAPAESPSTDKAIHDSNTFEIKSPDGSTYRVNAPKGASEQDALAYVKKNYDVLKALPIAKGSDPIPVEGNPFAPSAYSAYKLPTKASASDDWGNDPIQKIPANGADPDWATPIVGTLPAKSTDKTNRGKFDPSTAELADPHPSAYKAMQEQVAKPGDWGDALFVDKEEPPASPWVMLGNVLIKAFGAPFAVLGLGISFGWATKGFRI